MSDSYFVPVADNTWHPTIAASGAWRRDEQHLAATSALVAHAVGLHEPRDDMQIGRITFEVYGIIPMDDTHVEVTTVRPGRTIELLEAVCTINGRTAIHAHAWRLSKQDTSAYAALELPQMPPLADCSPDAEFELWDNPGYTSTMELRSLHDGRPGKRRAWLRSTKRLIEGVDAHPLGDFAICVDGANGLATRIHPTKLMYPNVELTIHFVREPEPGWVGLDTTVNFGPTGLGLTQTVLSDERGPVGFASQGLTVREFPST